MKTYRRINHEDRCQIYALNKQGSSQQSIAEILGISQSAVSRELARNRGKRGYRFKQAEAKAQARQAVRSKPRKLTAGLRRRIISKLRTQRWSPEQISGWLGEQNISLSFESKNLAMQTIAILVKYNIPASGQTGRRRNKKHRHR